MRKILVLLPIVSIIAGCKTGPTPQGMGNLAQFASYTGARVDMAKSTNHCAIYSSVTRTLDSMDASGNFDPVAFTAALQTLPIKELKDPRASILIGSAVILWDSYSSHIVSSNQLQTVRPVLEGVNAGLKKAVLDSGCP